MQYPVVLKRPFLSIARILSQPASTVNTFLDFLFGPLRYKWDPAERQAENHQEDEDYPACFRHFLFNDGHALIIAEWTFKGHGFIFNCLHYSMIISKLIIYRGKL